MKTTLLVVLLSFTLSAQLKNGAKECDIEPESAILSLLTRNIAELQAQLFVLSSGQLSANDGQNLKAVARGAVYSLANEFSALGNWHRQCLPASEEAYHNMSSQALHFVLALMSTNGSELWFRAMLEKWPLKDVPGLVGHLATNPAIRGHKLPMNPSLEQTLVSYAKPESSIDLTDPVRVAALELLGWKLDWNAKAFQPTSLFPIDRDNPINQERFYYSSDVQDFRNKSLSERIAVVATFYEQ